MPTTWGIEEDYTFYQGKIASRIRLIGRDLKREIRYISTLTLKKNNPTIDFEFQLNYLPNDKQGREVVAYWEVDGIKNEGVFFTDSNGMQM